MLHADLDAIRSSETGKAVFSRIEADHGAKLRAFKRLFSLHPLNDLQGVKFKLRTKYRDGAMLWSIEAAPFPGELEQTYKAIQLGSPLQPTVMIELYDAEGFKTGDAIELKVRLGSRTVNSKNEVVELSWSGTQPMTPDTYRSAAFVSTRWYGFKKE